MGPSPEDVTDSDDDLAPNPNRPEVTTFESDEETSENNSDENCDDEEGEDETSDTGVSHLSENK